MRKIPHVFPSWVINFFFLLGLVCAFAFRSIIVLEHLRPDLVRPVWYLAVLGYVLFFLYRYSIARKRRKTVTEYDLINKIRNGERLGQQEREAAVYSLSSIVRSREIFNYLVISILSVLAIGADLLLTLMGR
ncbi:MAG: hypothetical protein GF409_02585 [Candidatus Omnitrophica bacterium]|nr:hypothetical protein [Candidatus Omnitrophota bacterium]